MADNFNSGTGHRINSFSPDGKGHRQVVVLGDPYQEERVVTINDDGSINVNLPESSTITAVEMKSNSSSSSVVDVNQFLSTTLLSPNLNRNSFVVHNTSGVLFVRLGPDATHTNFTYRLTSNAVLEIASYTGEVSAIKLSGTSSVLVTEIQGA